MFEDLPIQFEEPGWLLLLALLIPTWAISVAFGQAISRPGRGSHSRSGPW